MSFQIRKFYPEQFEMIRDWISNENGNPGMYDHQAFQLIDKQRFWIGALNGQPIAAIAAGQYNHSLASVGWYVVKPEYRGKGYGLQIWQKAISRLNAKKIILSAVQSQQNNYKKSGFNTICKLIRYKILGTGVQHHSQNLVDCQKISINNLSKYDQSIFSVQRKLFLEKWISLPQSKATAYIKEEKIYGYGVLRVAFQGYYIGPLFADSYLIAVQILSKIMI